MLSVFQMLKSNRYIDTLLIERNLRELGLLLFLLDLNNPYAIQEFFYLNAEGRLILFIP